MSLTPLPCNSVSSSPHFFCDGIQYRAYLPNHLLHGKDEAAETVERKMALMIPPTCSSVAMLFSDIMSSTELWRLFPEGMIDALWTHNKTLREAAVRLCGYEVKELGA